MPEKSEYIIFDLQGGLLGMTKNIYEKFFRETKVSLELLLSIGNIFLLLP